MRRLDEDRRVPTASGWRRALGARPKAARIGVQRNIRIVTRRYLVVPRVVGRPTRDDDIRQRHCGQGVGRCGQPRVSAWRCGHQYQSTEHYKFAESEHVLLKRLLHFFVRDRRRDGAYGVCARFLRKFFLFGVRRPNGDG
jgi:hypothetical protein